MKLPHLSERFGDRFSSALILLAISLLIGLSGGLGRVDNLLYDLGQKLHSQTAPSDLVIVAIDEESLARLGRWPWSRHLHARLLDRLKNDGARVIGLDLVFAEPDANDPSSDLALAAAIHRAGNVVLPVLLESRRANGQIIETLPLPAFAEHAAAMGRVHVELDQDGIARSVFLWEGVGAPAWPHFAQAVLQAAHATPPDLAATAPEPATQALQPFILVRQDPQRVRFLGPPGYVQSLSYVQVLNGEFSPGLFKDKIVLVGATAAGMGDVLPTPVSGLSQPMSGVEFHANVLESMRHGQLISPLPRWISTLICALLAIAPMVWLPRLAPLQGLLTCGLWFAGIARLDMLLPGLAGIWLPPSAALVAIALAYPIWSWRKLEAALRFLDRELIRLHGEIGGTAPALDESGDPLQSRIAQVQAATRQLRQLQEDRRETLAFISHDIRAPLATAMLHLEENNSDPNARLRAPLGHALQLAEDFLHTSRAEMADARRFQEVELTAILHQAMDDAYPIAREKSVRLVREVPDEPVWLQGDFGLLHRAVLNLVLNAIRFSPANAEVTLALNVDRRYAHISVTDHGPGIPAEQQGQLFQRFIRSDNQAAAPEGSGLGLYFVRTVAEKHGGNVGVESEVGHRTCFTIRLPLDPAAVR